MARWRKEFLESLPRPWHELPGSECTACDSPDGTFGPPVIIAAIWPGDSPMYDEGEMAAEYICPDCGCAFENSYDGPLNEGLPVYERRPKWLLAGLSPLHELTTTGARNPARNAN